MGRQERGGRKGKEKKRREVRIYSRREWKQSTVRKEPIDRHQGNIERFAYLPNSLINPPHQFLQLNRDLPLHINHKVPTR